MDLTRRGRVRLLFLLAGVALVTACGSGQVPVLPSLPSLSLPGVDPALVPPPGPAPKTLSGRITMTWDQNDPDIVNDATFVVDVKLKADVIGTAQDGSEGFASYVDDGSTWTGAGLFRVFNKDPNGLCDSLDERRPNGSGGFAGAYGPRAIRAMTSSSAQGWTLQLVVQVDDIPSQRKILLTCQESHPQDVWGPGLDCSVPWLPANTFVFPGDCLDQPHMRTRGTLTGQ